MMQVLTGWEDFPSNLYAEYPGYDLEYCRRRLNDDSKRLFSDTCEIPVQTVSNSVSSDSEPKSQRTSINDLIKHEKTLEQVLKTHLLTTGSHFILLQQPHSWAPFDISREAFLKLSTALRVPPSFLGLIHGFGHPEDGYQRDFAGGYDLRLGEPKGGLHFLYTIRYMARTGRENWPWSERRVGICYSLADDSATWLILQHASFLRSISGLRLDKELDYRRLTGSCTIAQHVTLIEATLRTWNDYLKLLESQIRKDSRDARLDTSINRNANLDFAAAFSKLQSIQYRYEQVHDSMLALKANNNVLEGLAHLKTRCPHLGSENDRLEICKAQFMLMQTSAQDMLDRIKQVANLTSTLVNYQHGQAVTSNTASLDRMAHESRKGEELILNLTKATKKDSGTMKLIAVITMVYLPGTFVATLFSTSFVSTALNATASTTLQHRIIAHASSYGAVTATLMIVTMLVAYHWDRKMAREAEAQMARARDP
ncbi:hypothetical protein BDW02DRAFT_357122 [Decorospora gaudefroyi]|uniref:CorA-like transporter domain-containing protein n=1 Tax=Decorospora gaudefroyi TaxID=184978 RepID=A0A6A5KC05_9PLEO|nr:hypothetical protein BDW02DRAFT_357122 [Decorospora gaudefroyi]